MRLKKEPAQIGAFILGAAALAVFALAVFGSGLFSGDRQTYVLYFDGDLAGLKKGAPVTFRGVPIGQVTRIFLHFNMDNRKFHIPVLIEMDRGIIQATGKKEAPVEDDQILGELIRRGFRAKLQLQSLVTGQLYVDFDLYPEKATEFRRLSAADISADIIDPAIPELPTIPSDLEEFQRSIEKLPLETMIAKATLTLEGIERIINSPETMDALDSLGGSMTHLEELTRALHQKLPGLLTSAGNAMESINSLVIRANELAGELETTAAAANGALKQARITLRQYGQVVEGESPLGFRLLECLEELSGASRTVRNLAEYLERHPESLLRGKREDY
ncbi:MAG: hypothetical protein CSB33_02400 [Desulfobacterales bacterium]|nr:MAG: hypothetical protein CSB33_02400 [Desulfobacterales bacterium]